MDWTVYCEDEVVDLIDDHELAALMYEAEFGNHIRANVVIDLLRGVVNIS